MKHYLLLFCQYEDGAEKRSHSLAAVDMHEAKVQALAHVKTLGLTGRVKMQLLEIAADSGDRVWDASRPDYRWACLKKSQAI